MPTNELVEGGPMKAFVDVTGEVSDVLTAALGCILLGKGEAYPQARGPGVLNVWRIPTPGPRRVDS